MGGKVLRVVGAMGLVSGMVLVASAAAWPAPAGSDLPGDPPDAPRLERVLAVAGSALTEPPPQAGSTSDHASAGRGDPEAQADSESRDAYITRTCERILGQPPTGGLDKTTDPPDGTTVAAGDEIDVTLTWDPADWPGESLHKAIDCVTVNGALVLDLTVEERPTANDGSFETTYAIPADVVAGDEICDQGFLSGDSSGGGFEQDRSNQVCFTVEEASEPAAAAPPAPVPPAAEVPSPPVPAAPVAPATDVLGERLATPVSTPIPAPVAEETIPGPPVPELSGLTLPRTGQETRRGPLLAAGVALMFGGFGLIGGHRRPRPAPVAAKN